ncbi:hypothetical protein BU15DRAFT_43459 [Melanogaster broomeanus]|nr:hypothetical protein BU15DRAFT_43459 [Melanogaster broomeanus]
MLPALRALTQSSHRIAPASCAHKAHHLHAFLLGTPTHSLTQTRKYADANTSLTPTADTSRRPTNQKIPYTHVRTVDPVTSKLSLATTPLADILSSLDLKKYLVELVASTPEPIVRIVNRREALAKAKELKKARKQSAIKSGEAKEIQLSWSIDKADLGHKLAKARANLEKGYRVTVVLAPKAGQRGPPHKEMQMRAREVAEALVDIGKEWRERELTKGMVIMSFQKHSV